MTIPWPDSWIVFLLALTPITVLAVIWHEAGHVLAARCAGLTITAWGVGFRKPFFHRRIGTATFYVGFPLSGGLTHYIRPCIERRAYQEFIAIAGGPLATVLGLAVGILLWNGVGRSDILVVWIFVSAIFTVLSVLPLTVKNGPLRLQTDAWHLIDIARYGRQTEGITTGATLATLRAMAELMSQIKCDAGSAYANTWASVLEATLGDLDGAKTQLDCAEQHRPELHGQAGIFAFARAALAVSNSAEDADQLLDIASDKCAGDETAEFLIDCLQQRLRHSRGEDIGDELHQLRERALAASRQDWLSIAETMLFETKECDEPEVALRELLKRFSRYVATSTKAKLLAINTERLASRGDIGRARALFAESQLAIATEAAATNSEPTRRACIAELAKPLQRALAATTNGEPIFIPDLAATIVKPPSHRKAFANVTFAMGLISALAATIGLIMYVASTPTHSPIVAAEMILLISVCFLVSLITGLTSILRREQKMRRVLIGFGLAVVAIYVAVTFLTPVIDTY